MIGYARYNRFYLIKNIIFGEFLVDLFSLGEIGMLSRGRRNQFGNAYFLRGVRFGIKTNMKTRTL